MQEVIRRCDYQVSKGKVCGEKVPDNAPTEFAVDAVNYEADLCAAHKKEMLTAMKSFLDIASPTKTRAGRAVRSAIRGKKGTFTTKDVRAWLQEQGREVSPTGRIPNDLIEEYKVAQGV